MQITLMNHQAAFVFHAIARCTSIRVETRPNSRETIDHRMMRKRHPLRSWYSADAPLNAVPPECIQVTVETSERGVFTDEQSKYT